MLIHLKLHVLRERKQVQSEWLCYPKRDFVRPDEIYETDGNVSAKGDFLAEEGVSLGRSQLQLEMRLLHFMQACLLNPQDRKIVEDRIAEILSQRMQTYWERGRRV